MTNELLSMEQLDEISGGDVYESADDSQFLNKLNGSCDRYGELKLALANRENEIRNGWTTVGIDAKIHTGAFFTKGADNEYFLNGKKISRDAAYMHAQDVVGIYIRRDEWSY